MKAYTFQTPPDESLRKIARYLLEQKGYAGVFALSRKDTGEYTYALITDKVMLDTIVPTYPLMPANAGKLLSRLTMLEAVQQPLAAMIRPCELRALFELIKLEQARLDNILFISYTCSGVLDLKTKKDELEKKTAEYWEQIKTGTCSESVRETCSMCEQFEPDNADIGIPLAIQGDVQHTTVFAKTPKGDDALSGIDAPSAQGSIDQTALDRVRSIRTAEKKKIFNDLQLQGKGWDNLINLFGRCIQCGACRSVCPICFCKLCYINTPEKDVLPLTLEQQLKQTGTLHVPYTPVLYHLVRLYHVSAMCVGCGMCSDICPVSIPIASIFTKVSKRIQEDLDYSPGKRLDQEMPLAIVRPEDFAEKTTVEEKS